MVWCWMCVLAKCRCNYRSLLISSAGPVMSVAHEQYVFKDVPQAQEHSRAIYAVIRAIVKLLCSSGRRHLMHYVTAHELQTINRPNFLSFSWE
jgi:hypothetical protein